MSRGAAAAQMAQEMIEALGKHVHLLLHSLFARLQELANQVKPVEAAYRIERQDRSQGRSEPHAGYESKAENAASIKPLTDIETSAVRMAFADSLGTVVDPFRPSFLPSHTRCTFSLQSGKQMTSPYLIACFDQRSL